MSESIQEQYLNGKRKTILVEYAHICSRYVGVRHGMDGGDIYYCIEYKPIDEKSTYRGFGSYWLDLVLGWLNTEFEVVAAEDTKSTVCEEKK